MHWSVSGSLFGGAGRAMIHRTLLGALAFVAVAFASTSLASATTGADAEPRAYEMVTPADKISRKGSGSTRWRDFDANGLHSPDGNRIFVTSNYYSMMSGGFPFPTSDNIVLERDPINGWNGRSIITAKPHSAVHTGTISVVGNSFDANFENFVIRSSWPLITEANPLGNLGWVSRLYTRYSDDRGFREWLSDPSQVPTGVSDGGARAFAYFTDDGKEIIRSGQARGLLGENDPSLQQLPGTAGGDTIYRQDYKTEEFSLVNECTGEGEDATAVPERTTDGKLNFRSCPAGTIVDRRGAHIGGGGGTTSTSASAVISAPSSFSVSPNGDRIYFVSPVGVSTACTAGTLENTACPTQLYLRQRASDGKEVVRWISKPQIQDQDIGLLGRGVMFEGASEDGRVVYFSTNAVLTADDPNGGDTVPAGGIKTGTASTLSWDVFKYELSESPDVDPDEGELTRITGGPTGLADPNTKCSSGSGAICLSTAGAAVRYLSNDGSRAYIVTTSPIDMAIDEPPAGAHPDNVPRAGASDPRANLTTRNIYLYDSNKLGRKRWKFVANIPFSTASTTGDGCASFFNGYSGIYTPAGTSARPVPSNTSANCFRGTEDGRLVVFQTSGRLTADDNDSATDVYAYDSEEDRLYRLTAPPAGVDPYPCAWSSGTNPSITGYCNGQLGGRLAKETDEAMRHNNVASDGEVFFESRLPLLPDEDINGDYMDVYSWKDGELSLISPGKAEHDAYFGSNTLDGESVFFATTEPLDPYHEFEAADVDIYVARRGGGFPPPKEPVPCSLADDQCHGKGAESPPGDVVATATAQAPQPPVSREPHRTCPRTASQERRLRAMSRRLRRRASRAGGQHARVALRRARTASKKANKLAAKRKNCERRNGGKTR